MTKYYCQTRQEVVGALSAALDMIEEPVEINHKSGFRLTLDLGKVPAAKAWPEFTQFYTKRGTRERHRPTAEEKHAALPAEVRYRQAIARWQKLVAASPQNIWR